MNAPFRYPEAGPLDDETFNLPEYSIPVLTDIEILQHIRYCRDGEGETAFGQTKQYWDNGIVDDWAAEWDKANGPDRIMDATWAALRIPYINQMMVLHAKQLLKERRVPIELMIEEGLI